MVADRLRAVPAWAWVAIVVVASFALRAWLARGMAGPFIMTDELTYAEMGRTLADSGEFLVRGLPASGYSVVYPLFISPAYALFHSLPEAYTAVKMINAALMSLAAVPAYFLARRMLPLGLSLLAAVLAVALPSMVYTGTVMTENAFYPIFLLLALQLVVLLERPSAGRLVALGFVLVLAYLTRVQTIVAVPAVLAAPLVLVLFERRPAREVLRPFATMYAAVAAGAVLVLGVEAARGRSPTKLFGAYSVVGEKHYDVGSVAKFLFWHLAELDLYLGVLPVAAMVILVGLARRQPRPVRVFLAAALPLTAAMTVAVAAFASQFADRIQERNLFVVAPFFVIALLVWIHGGAPRRPWPLALGAAALAALLPLGVPYDRFIQTAAISDTLALLPIWNAFGHLPFGGSIGWTVAAGGLALGVLFLVLPRRVALAGAFVVLAYFGLVSRSVWSGPHGFLRASEGALFQGIQGVPRDWIDRVVPDGTSVAVVWTGRTDRFTINQNEFFNRSVGPVYYVGAPTPGGLAETQAVIGRRGAVRTIDGAAIRPRYVLLDGTFDPDADLIRRDAGTGMTLWRLDGPLTAANLRITGLYPNDTWSGRRVVYRKEPCRGGLLAVAIGSDPALFDRPSTVVARSGGEEIARTRLDPDVGRTTFRVPLVPRDRVCRVVFEMSPTEVPSRVDPDSDDDRVLGAHFYGFVVER